MDGDAAQVDRLVLHRNGFIIIESKSVSGQVEINGRGEWSRVYQGRKEGIPSPVLQAERQAAFIKRYLEKHVEHLLDKMLLGSVQKHFGYFFSDVLVAISDNGLIKRSGSVEIAKVYKADQIPKQVAQVEERYRLANRPLSLNLKDTGLRLSEKEFARVTAFLRNHHRPLETDKASTLVPPSSSNRASKAAAPLAAYQCRSCKGTNLFIKHSYTYHFQCLDCGANTAISNVCKRCNKLEKTRKERERFYGECPECRTSEVFYANPSTMQSEKR